MTPDRQQAEERAKSAARHPIPDVRFDSGLNLNPGRRVSIAMTLWLVAIWVVVFSQISWIVVLSGVLFAVVIQLVLPMPTHRNLWHFRVGFLIILVTRFVWDLVHAGVQVSGLVLSGKPHEDGIVECQTRSGNPVYMTIVAAMCSMIPGTVVLKVDPGKRAMYLHALNLPAQGGVEGVRSSVASQEKRVLLAVATTPAVVDAGYGNSLPLKRNAKKGAASQ